MNPRLARMALVFSLGVVPAGCALQFKQEEQQAEQMAVNCATAQGDLRVLESEKAHVAEQLAMGVSAIYPAGAVMGLLEGTEGTKLQVATGEYNQKIQDKIDDIRLRCGGE
jgi:hypothetical protein